MELSFDELNNLNEFLIQISEDEDEENDEEDDETKILLNMAKVATMWKLGKTIIYLLHYKKSLSFDIWQVLIKNRKHVNINYFIFGAKRKVISKFHNMREKCIFVLQPFFGDESHVWLNGFVTSTTVVFSLRIIQKIFIKTQCNLISYLTITKINLR